MWEIRRMRQEQDFGTPQEAQSPRPQLFPTTPGQGQLIGGTTGLQGLQVLQCPELRLAGRGRLLRP